MLSKIYIPKQIEILKACRNTDWFMLINHGAKRSGKTQLDNDLFLAELPEGSPDSRSAGDRYAAVYPGGVFAGKYSG